MADTADKADARYAAARDRAQIFMEPYEVERQAERLERSERRLRRLTRLVGLR